MRPLLLSALMLGFLSVTGCAPLSDLKPSSPQTKLYDGTQDNTLMLLLANRWYPDICQPSAQTQAEKNTCYTQHKAMLSSIRQALPLMQNRDRKSTKDILAEWTDELLDAGTDQEDKRLKGWLK